jgi:hypothetical protein
MTAMRLALALLLLAAAAPTTSALEPWPGVGALRIVPFVGTLVHLLTQARAPASRAHAQPPRA